jgi:hypothetical protein
MDVLLEEVALTAIYNKCKNGKELCDYQCGEKFKRDMFVQPKMNVCKANCDVIWDRNFVTQLQLFLQQNTSQLSSDMLLVVRKRLDTAKQRLENSKKRLLKTKMALKKVLYGRRQDMSMNMPKQGPAFE